MNFLEFIRRIAFWFLDFVKGRPIWKHYQDIKYINENLHSQGVRDKLNAELNNLLAHSLKTVPYYSKLNPDSTIADFPVIDKSIFRDNFNLFESASFKSKQNYKVTTSGSTGNPFSIYHDTNKRFRNSADTIYFSSKLGYKVGDRLYYLRLWDKQYGRSKLLSGVQNMIPISVDELDDQNIERFLIQLQRDKSTMHILSYVSALHSICKHLDNKKAEKLNCRIKSIIGVAEGLNDYVKMSVQKYFNTEIVSRYSNSENGILAQQTTGNTYFEINHASYYMEILDLNKDVPAAIGQTGRIVITDLYNFCMPLIRYDTGDVGKFTKINDRYGQRLVLAEIEGRKMDMFTNTKGEYISSHIIHHILQYNAIDQFQFIEEENNEYIIKLKVTDDFDYNEEKSIIAQYKEYFGDNASIRVEYVRDIPLLASGKRKLVINRAVEKLK